MNEQEFFDDALKLCNINRYQGARHFKEESVAEHSFLVATIIYNMSKSYKFDLKKAIIAGLLHDLAESHISDVPHPIKKAHPEIEEALNKVEEEYLSSFLDNDILEILKDFNAADKAKTPEALIIAYADAKSVSLYAQEEAKCGVEYFKEVLKGADIRVEKVLKSLEKFKL